MCSYGNDCIERMLSIGIFSFFFSSRRRHTRWNCDWSSDVCSSDLADAGAASDVLELDVAALLGEGGARGVEQLVEVAGRVGALGALDEGRGVGCGRQDRKSVV